MDAEAFRAAMRHSAGAVAIVAAGGEGARNGLVVTSVCSLSDRPPSLLVCVNRESGTHARIRAERCFGVSFLGRDQAALALAFSGQTGLEGDERFGVGTWRAGRTGAPILAEAAASFDCRLLQEVGVATHSIFLGEIAAAEASGARPLLYHRGAYHEIGAPLAADLEADSRLSETAG